MGYAALPCDWCRLSDPCRYQWLDDDDLPCVFCSLRCMENYIFWQLATSRRRRMNQDKIEQNKTGQDNAEHREV